MLVRIDREANVIYAHWGSPEAKAYSREVAPGVFLEEDERGVIVGIEVLSASSRASAGALDHVDVEIFANELAKR